MHGIAKKQNNHPYKIVRIHMELNEERAVFIANEIGAAALVREKR